MRKLFSAIRRHPVKFLILFLVVVILLVVVFLGLAAYSFRWHSFPTEGDLNYHLTHIGLMGIMMGLGVNHKVDFDKQ